jgi:hypothetical protein
MTGSLGVSVVASWEVARHIPSRFERLGDVRLKGVTNPQPVYALK